MRALATSTDGPLSRILVRHRWVPFVLPFVVYMLLGSLEPTRDDGERMARVPAGADHASAGTEQDQGGWGSLIPYRYYPLYYSLRLAATVAVLLPFFSTYVEFAPRVTALAATCGAVGALLWIGLCRLDLEVAIADHLGLRGWLTAAARPGFDPFSAFADSPIYLALFLAARFLGLVGVVAVIEEFFLRGFVMRFVAQADWWLVPIGQPQLAAVLAGTCYGVLTHPSEALAAAVWFTLVTGLVCKTGNIWDAIVAHATTNLLLGIYVVVWQDWSFW